MLPDASYRDLPQPGAADVSGQLVFTQLTFRETLRDIETCLGAAPEKRYHLGLRTVACTYCGLYSAGA